MAYPVFAPGGTWFAPNDVTITRGVITEIEIMDSYMPDDFTTITDSWDASEAKDGSIICYAIGTKMIIAGNGSGKITLNKNSKGMFSDSDKYTDYFNELTQILNAHLFDFSMVEDAWFFLAYCRKLSYIDVSTWDLSNAKNIGAMFSNCNLLDNIDVTNWNVSNVEWMDSLFNECFSLQNLDLSGWNLKKDNFTLVERGVGFSQLFLKCSNLTSIGDCSNWDVKCSSMRLMFYGCSKLKNINLGKIYFNPLDAQLAMQYPFSGCTELESIAIKSLDFSTNVSLEGLFQNSSKLKNIDLNIDFSKVTDISFMFYGCTGLKEIDVSNWDVSNVTNFDHFAAHAKLKRKGIENWNTASAINMNAMFHNCAEEELDLSKFDVSNVKYFCQMFENSPNLKRIKGLEKWDTSSGVGFDEMFGRCRKLEEVDLSSFDTSKAKNGEKASENGHTTNTFSNIFQECNNLKKITLGPKFSINGDGTNTSATKKLTFPTPSATYIQEADGNWYDIEGNSYAPDGMLDKTAKTYYAVLSEAFDSDTVPVMVNRGSLTKVAHALRKKTGKTGKMKLNSFSEEIDSFEGEMLVLDDNTTIEAETLIIGGV